MKIKIITPQQFVEGTYMKDKQIKKVVIDPVNRTVTTTGCQDLLASMYSLLECETVEVVRMGGTGQCGKSYSSFA
jgi:hypothetical protein